MIGRKPVKNVGIMAPSSVWKDPITYKMSRSQRNIRKHLHHVLLEGTVAEWDALVACYGVATLRHALVVSDIPPALQRLARQLLLSTQE